MKSRLFFDGKCGFLRPMASARVIRCVCVPCARARAAAGQVLSPCFGLRLSKAAFTPCRSTRRRVGRRVGSLPRDRSLGRTPKRSLKQHPVNTRGMFMSPSVSKRRRATIDTIEEPLALRETDTTTAFPKAHARRSDDPSREHLTPFRPRDPPSGTFVSVSQGCKKIN